MLSLSKLMQLHDEACEARHCNGSHLYNLVSAKKRNDFKKTLELELTSAGAEGYWDGYSQLKEEIAMALNKAGFNLLDQNTGYKVVNSGRDLTHVSDVQYTNPTNEHKKWVGLTPSERGSILNPLCHRKGLWEIARDIENKLKEKNT